MMLSDEVAPPPAVIISRVNRSSTVLTGEVCQLTQIRLGSE